jgi:histidinol phosphatase-like PHP family hydrolase
MLLNSDLHSPDDFLTEEFAQKILRGAGLDYGEVRRVMDENPKELLKRLKKLF